MLRRLIPLLAAACAVAPPAPPEHVRIAGRSVEGRPIEYHVLGYGKETTLILATIHGNEPAGTPLVRRLRAELIAAPELLRGRRVVLVPVANPDGLARGSRKNVHGVDLNRNFPATNHRIGEALSEPESRAIFGLVRTYRPARVISIHQPIAVIDYDGPGEALARVLSEASGLAVKKLGARPGSLGSYVGVDLGRPIITVELPGGVESLGDAELWARYGRMMMLAVTAPR